MGGMHYEELLERHSLRVMMIGFYSETEIATVLHTSKRRKEIAEKEIIKILERQGRLTLAFSF